MDQPDVWAAVESVVSELNRTEGYLGSEELVTAIPRGLQTGSKVTEATVPMPDAFRVSDRVEEGKFVGVPT